ncbi:hypothetical protein [Roseibium aggregatum]|uniref:Uncharacterized protein n=1 Tax=Roseibium aggregatum TaxID=187304 RepID=A0A926S4Y6_9HYPH|nr:hypothetical protein [Roseibium aggregatum]MBD1544882.1 hypothetical protein [Roseibium aggregatum]
MSDLRSAIINDYTNFISEQSYKIGNVIYKYNSGSFETGSRVIDAIKSTGDALTSSSANLEAIDSVFTNGALWWKSGYEFDVKLGDLNRALEKKQLKPLNESELSRLKKSADEAFRQGIRGRPQYDPENDQDLENEYYTNGIGSSEFPFVTESSSGLPTQRKPIVIPRSTFNLFSDLTTMTTAALEREQRENRLAYDDLTEGEAYRVLTDGAGQVATRFEPGNQPDLDLAQTGDDVTLHGGGKFVPRGKSAPHEAAPYGVIPEPRAKPDIFRMMPGPIVPDPIATPDLQGMRPDRSIPVPGTKPGLPGGQ